MNVFIRVKCSVREQLIFACLTPVIYFGLRSKLVNVVYKTIRDRDLVQKNNNYRNNVRFHFPVTKQKRHLLLTNKMCCPTATPKRNGLILTAHEQPVRAQNRVRSARTPCDHTYRR